ncbi:DegT/DnrJ/EryC1/StrS family aminotransferase [Solibacillus sp. FSL W7-1324]|uniref:DegT/DnrJ/EryC1/StrS family aminotransferase n=1 Tax=Solibacillus sp. FSL W7-1324 TaxID=2921701 RepID=UPI0030F90F42
MISHNSPSYTEKVVAEGYKQLEMGNFSRRHVSYKAEVAFAKFTNSLHARLVSSGFAAIQAALIAVGVQKGDEVTIPNITCPSVYHAILSIGAIPHVVDVSEKVPLIDTKVLKMWNVKKFCLIPNMFGIKAEIDSLEFENIIFIEDNAQCLSPNRSEWAKISIYSFSPTKILTIGYGGAVVSDNENLMKRVALFLDCDYHLSQTEESNSLPFRIHADISDFQAAMLMGQLERYESIISYRNNLSKLYDENLSFSRINSDVPFRYLLKLQQSNAFECAELLQSKFISSVPLSSHLLSDIFDLPDEYPNSYFWKNSVLSLPLHEGIEDTDLKYICKVINQCF